MSDTPPWAGPIPVLLTGAWQTKQFDAGRAGGIDETVLDALNAPPAAAAFITAANFAALPEVGGVGRAYKTTDNGKRWIWNGYGYFEVKRTDGTSYSN
jgi:hypothetical protein